MKTKAHAQRKQWRAQSNNSGVA